MSLTDEIKEYMNTVARAVKPVSIIHTLQFLHLEGFTSEDYILASQYSGGMIEYKLTVPFNKESLLISEITNEDEHEFREYENVTQLQVINKIWGFTKYGVNKTQLNINYKYQYQVTGVIDSNVYEEKRCCLINTIDIMKEEGVW